MYINKVLSSSALFISMLYYRDYNIHNAIYYYYPPKLTLPFPSDTQKPTIWLAKLKKPHGSSVARTWSNLNSDSAHENVNWYNHCGKQFVIIY